MEWALQVGVSLAISVFALSQCNAKRFANSVPDLSVSAKISNSKESTSVSRKGRVQSSTVQQQKQKTMSNDSKSARNSEQTENELHPQRTQTSISKSCRSHTSKKTARKKTSMKQLSKRLRKTPNVGMDNNKLLIRKADSKPSKLRSNRRINSQPNNGKVPRTRTEEDDEALHSSFLERRRKMCLAQEEYDPQKTQTVKEYTRHERRTTNDELHVRHEDANQRAPNNRGSKGSVPPPPIRSVATQDDRTEEVREVNQMRERGARDADRARTKQSAGSAATAKTHSNISKMERTQDQET